MVDILTKRSMTARAFPKVAVLAASFLLALWAFAPTQALAHAGHDHGVVEGAPKPGPVIQIAPSAEPVKGDGATSSPANESIIENVSVAASKALASGDMPAKSKSCPGGCCQSAGASCCAVSLLTALASIEPPLGRSVFSTTARRGVGITPGALSKPPKSLV